MIWTVSSGYVFCSLKKKMCFRKHIQKLFYEILHIPLNNRCWDMQGRTRLRSDFEKKHFSFLSYTRPLPPPTGAPRLRLFGYSLTFAERAPELVPSPSPGAAAKVASPPALREPQGPERRFLHPNLWAAVPSSRPAAPYLPTPAREVFCGNFPCKR